MSRGPDEAQPPRRPRPQATPVDPFDLDGEGASTFQPNPRVPAQPAPRPRDPSAEVNPPRAGGPTNGRARKAEKGTREPLPASGGPNFFERVVYGKVGSGHLAMFCGQFATYQDAGVDLVRSLSSLGKQFGRTALGPVIARIEQQVRSGENLADAMGREPRAFDPLCLSMIRVAEARGGIPETLRLLARHYEARQRMIRQARSAMIYPSIVLLVASGVVMLLTIFVIPLMVSFIQDGLRGKNVDLPFPTRVLLGISAFMTWIGWWAVPLGVVGGGFVSLWWYRTPAGKAMFDALSLYVPVLGKIRKKIETGRFARTLAALLNAGVDIGSSLDLTAGVLGLAPFRRATLGMKTLVMDGDDLSEAVQRTGRFGTDVVAMIDAGEQSGRLPESLDKVADDYEEQVEYMVKNLGNLIQPILTIGLGAIVGFIILGVIMAYLQMLTSAM